MTKGEREIIKWIHEIFCTEYWSTFYGKRNAAQEMERKKSKSLKAKESSFFILGR